MKICGYRKLWTGETKVIQRKKKPHGSRRMKLMGHVRDHFVDLRAYERIILKCILSIICPFNTDKCLVRL